MMYLGLGILALCIGSFLNVLIFRLPKIMEYEYLLECSTLLNQPKPDPLNLNLWWPRSFCPTCNHTISAFSNIPFLSYLMQKGKCKSCQSTISLQYPLIEITTLLLSLFAAYQFGFTSQLGFALMFIWMLIPLFAIDIEHYLLPDQLTLGLLWTGLIANTQTLFCPLSEAVFGAVIGYMVLWILVKLFYLCTGKVGMGQGDFKLFAALGAWFGVFLIPFMLLLASITGVIGGLIYLKSTHQSRNTPIAFGPFLCVTGVLTLFFGNTVFTWYLGL